METHYTHVIIWTDGEANVNHEVAKFYAADMDTAKKITRAYVKSTVAMAKKEKKAVTKGDFKLFKINKPKK